MTLQAVRRIGKCRFHVCRKGDPKGESMVLAYPQIYAAFMGGLDENGKRDEEKSNGEHVQATSWKEVCQLLRSSAMLKMKKWEERR